MSGNTASKIADFRYILRGDEDIGRLHVHMNDAVVMNVIQTGDNVFQKAEQSPRRESVGRRFDDLVEISASAILHDDVDRFFGRQHLLPQRHGQRAHDVHMLQIEDLLFRSVTILPITATLNARLVRGLRGQFARHDLDGQIHIEPFAEKDFAETAGTQEIGDDDVALLDGLERNGLATNDLNLTDFFEGLSRGRRRITALEEQSDGRGLLDVGSEIEIISAGC